MENTPVPLYDLWAETYPPVAHNPLMRAEQAALVRALGTIRADSALDVGTGSGRCLPLVAATGATRIAAADFSLRMLHHNRGRARVCADARQLPFPSGHFDLVNASLIAGDIPDLFGWCRELARLLAPGGHLLYSDFHPAWTTFGWQRTFADASGTVHALPRHEHRLSDHGVAVGSAGLELVALDTISLRAPGPFAWLRRRVPAAVLVHARRKD